MTKCSEVVNETMLEEVRSTGIWSKSNKTELNNPEKQCCPLKNLIRNMRRSGGRPSIDSLSSELNKLPARNRASALLMLQGAHGNRYVQRTIVQAKLKVNKPGDIYEQDADRMADRIMQMPEPADRNIAKVLQMTHVLGNSVMPENFLPISHGAGQPLPLPERAFFESRFGHDFSRVQIHANALAFESAEAIGAKAYTIGQNIAFGAGYYNPYTDAGKRLISHELTHVIQQQGSGNEGSLIQRDDTDDPRRPPLNPPILPTEDPPYWGAGFKSILKWDFGNWSPSPEGRPSLGDDSLSTDQFPEFADRFQWNRNCPLERQDALHSRCCNIGEVFDITSLHCIPEWQRSRPGRTPPPPSIPSLPIPLPSRPPDCPEERWNAIAGKCCEELEIPSGLGCEDRPIPQTPGDFPEPDEYNKNV
jgi:hypothetical protein